MSRYPTRVNAIFDILNLQQETEADADVEEIARIEQEVKCMAMETLDQLHAGTEGTSPDSIIPMDRLKNVCLADNEYKLLADTVEKGFPATRQATTPELRVFWEMGQQNRLSCFGPIVLLDKRLVIPKTLRNPILKALHSAHQGCSGMRARANQTVYWPGLNRAIKDFRLSCETCTSIAPSQPAEPLMDTPIPDYPYQAVVGDYFELNGKAYLTVADRFSGNIHVFYFKRSPTSKSLVTVCRDLFLQYGGPEEFSSDGGPQFIKEDAFQLFLKQWGCKHRLSSAGYPQSNGRAESAVKTAKRMIRDNIAKDGSLDTQKFAKAILQYRNTPLKEGGLSPAQILFHRDLRDFIPSHPSKYQLSSKWLHLAKSRENRIPPTPTQQLSSRKELKPLEVGTRVIIQSQGFKKRWDKTGKIIETLLYRQYLIRLDGSGIAVRRNRKHIRQDFCNRLVNSPPISTSTDLKSTTTQKASTGAPSVTIGAQSDTQERQTAPPSVQASDTNSLVNAEQPYTTSPLNTSQNLMQGLSKVPRALSRLASYNNPGLKEGITY